MSDNILKQVREDMFEAVKEGQETITGVTRSILASVKNAEIEKEDSLETDEIVDLLRKETKKLNDSIEQFVEAGRDDLVEEYKEQVEYIEQYLPDLMDEEEIEKHVKDVIDQVGAENMGDIGKVMGKTMQDLKGKADGAKVKEVVQKLLN
jgi:hypothetical protein